MSAPRIGAFLEGNRIERGVITTTIPIALETGRRLVAKEQTVPRIDGEPLIGGPFRPGIESLRGEAFDPYPRYRRITRIDRKRALEVGRRFPPTTLAALRRRQIPEDVGVAGPGKKGQVLSLSVSFPARTGLR